MQISITRALSELKVLQKRFDKEVSQLDVISVQHGMTLMKNSSVKPEDFSEKAKAQLQSVEDLQKRIHLIKTKVQQSNAITVVKIGTQEMTVLEAIIKKSLIENQKDLLARLKKQLILANDNFEAATVSNENKIANNLKMPLRILQLSLIMK